MAVVMPDNTAVRVHKCAAGGSKKGMPANFRYRLHQFRLRIQQPQGDLDQLRHLLVAEPVDIKTVGNGVSILHHIGQIVVVFRAK